MAVHNCLLHVDDEHCSEFFGERMIDTDKHVALKAEMHQFTPEEQKKLIIKMAQKDRQIQAHKDCFVGVGYNACIDVSVRAKDLFQALNQQLNQEITLNGEFKPQVHLSLTNLRELFETFLYYFQRGANSERGTNSQQLFDMLLKTINQIDSVKELGGHSLIWAERGQIEQCRVYAVSEPYPFLVENIVKDTQEHNYLVYPKSKLIAPEKEDIHFVFEYNEGDEILGYTAPRSNRFYFVNDPNGSRFRQLEDYHSLQKETFTSVQRHMFGGFQQLQVLPYSEAEHRLNKMEYLWHQMRSQPDTDHRIHVEFAHFTTLEMFSLFEKYAISNADSLGMNEQELKLILDYWQGNHENIMDASDSKPTLEGILKQTKQFFELAKKNETQVSRVHMHPHGHFLMCYDKSKWEDAAEAIFKSSITLPKYCVREADGTTPLDWANQYDNFVLPTIPAYIQHPADESYFMQTNKEDLTHHFELSEDIDCYLQFFIRCKNMVKTAGMGDTISGTGFMYHIPK